MTKYMLAVLLLGAISQSAQTSSASQQPAVTPQTGSTTAASIAPDTPVITINGVCDHPSGEKPGPNCKTIITRAQFELMVQAIQPNLSPDARRNFAQKYAEALVIDEKIRETGADKGPKFEVRSQVGRTQALAQELNVVVAEEAAKISDQEVEDYYRQNPDRFVEADLSRILIPGIQQLPDPPEKLSEADLLKRNQASEAVMRDEADKLHARAAASEDMGKLQTEAFALALVTGAQPPVKMGKVRGMDMPDSQVSVMELKTGEVSQPILEKRGYLIYRIGERRVIPLAEIHDELRRKLVGMRSDARMDAILKSATPKLDETYFGK